MAPLGGGLLVSLSLEYEVAVQDEIDLFPLNIVLFPGSWIPLHIFEERYKQLIQQCRETREVFGVNLLQGSELSTIGCTARVAEVLREYDDGRMDIVVAGGRRFQVQHIEERPKACIHAHIEYFDDVPDPSFNQAVYEECVELYNRLVEQVFPNEQHLSLQENTVRNLSLSFVMAQKAGLELEHKQRLLESQSENERLLMLLHHMREVLPTLDQQNKQSVLVRLDGYVRRSERF